MSGEELTRTSSVKSDVSTVSLASTDLDSDQLYDTCPWDVYGEAEGLGRVRVVKAGVALPATTGYKAKKDGSAEVGVQFRWVHLVVSFLLLHNFAELGRILKLKF